MDYDISGLESFGLGAFLDASHVKGAVMSGAVGGAGILLTTTALAKVWPQPAAGSGSMFAPDAEGGNGTANYRRARSALTAVVGLLAGRALYDRNRDAAISVMGATMGLGFAELVASWVNDPASTTGPTVMTSNLSGHLSLADLRALEMAVSTPMMSYQGASAMNGFGGPVVRSAALSAPVTSATELGAMAAYMPYLS